MPLAAQCSTEAFKLATYLFDNMDNYTFFNQTEGVLSFTYPADKKDDCLVCGQTRKIIKISKSKTLSELIELLKGQNDLVSPALTTSIDGIERTLYLDHIESTRTNLERQLAELGLVDCQEISVTDKTYVAPVTVQLQFVK